MNLTCSKLWSTRLPRLGKSFIVSALSLSSAFSGLRGRNKASVQGVSNFLAAALFAGCILWPSASPAASSLPTNDVETFTADDIGALLFAASGGTKASSGNITNDVAAILELLQGVRTIRTSASVPTYRIATVPTPFPNRSATFGLLLNRMLADGASDATEPAATSSYLYELQRSIVGSSGVSSDPLIPLLKQWLPIVATNVWSQADIESVVNALYGSNQSVGNNVETIRNLLETLASSNQMARVEELLGTIDEDLPSAQSVSDMADAIIAIYESAPEGNWQSLLAHVDASAALFDPGSDRNVVYDGYEPSRAINVHVDFDTMSDIADIVETYLGDQTDTIMSFLTGHPWEPDSDHFFEGSVTNDLSDILERLDIIVGFDTNDVVNAFRVFASGFATNNLHLGNIVDELGYTNTARSVAVDFSNLLARLENIRSNDLQSSSLAALERDSTAGYGESYDYGLTNAPLPQYQDPIADADTSSMSSSLEAGQSTFEDVAADLKGLIRPTQADDEIVLIPEMTIGGIHVDEYRARLGTSITPVCRRIMQFIWGVSLFAALFGLASAEWAFYANLGRNWTMSGGFHEKGAP